MEDALGVFEQPTYRARAANKPEWAEATVLFAPRGNDSLGEEEAGSFRMLCYAEERLRAEVARELPAALANLELTAEAIGDFTQEYGYLGVPQPYRVATHPDPRYGEQFDAWYEAVGVLRVIWREITGNQKMNPTEGLKVSDEGSLVLRDGKTAYLFQWAIDCDWCRPSQARNLSARSRVARRGEAVVKVRPNSLPVPLLCEQFLLEEHDLRAARDDAVCQVISHYTRQLVGIEIADSANGPMIKAVPRNLLGAAWLQMARDFEEGAFDYLRCPECRRWYRKGRRTQNTCGRSKCRGKAYGRRRDRARALADSGVDNARIAATMSDELGENVAVKAVDGWLKASTKRRSATRRSVIR